MAKILLIAGQGIKGIPQEVISWMQQYKAAGHEFIVGDTRGDGAFHNAISGIGGKSSCTVYAMDKANTNAFSIRERIFDTYYDEETKVASIVDKDSEQIITQIHDVADETVIRQSDAWYKFKDNYMVDECAMAILVLPEAEQMTKRVQNILMRMSIQNKPRYVFKV